MSNVQPAAPATRNRRSDRHAPAKQVTPLPPAPSKKPAAKPGAGKFPVRTCIVLGMVLIICILALGIARGNLNRLHKERENAAAEYSGLNYKYNISEMPEGMAFTYLYEMLRAAENGEVSLEDDKYFTESKNGSRTYRLYLGATGLPISAEDLRGGFSAEFKNVTLG